MKKEMMINAKSVEEAVAEGAKMLGIEADKVEYEVIEEPKKGFLGVGATPAKVMIRYQMKPEETALDFVQMLIRDMELTATAELTTSENGNPLINISGESAGVLIGHHGDTLDALQYLTNLAAIRSEEGGFAKIVVDVENYRAKREETLRRLARRMAGKALKYQKSFTLEPMSPYERRIIHSEVQGIEGVSTNSVGSDNNRKVVIYLTDQPLPQILKNGDGDRAQGGRRNRNDRSSRSTEQRTRTSRPAGKPASNADGDAADKPVSQYTYVHAPTPRPEKLKSVASYFGDAEEEADTAMEKPEDTSALAKLCGIYDEAPLDTNTDLDSDDDEVIDD